MADKISTNPVAVVTGAKAGACLFLILSCFTRFTKSRSAGRLCSDSTVDVVSN
ncbi:hypothetical protein CCACVL1_08962 [Corchorus capsularis]|uniref:Uncharacterized protein n=1 Tax=Corchorus capsularis TaxID=210143 RepID=A0A1R3IY73_COCAP|nr:hypothetical protein CCACVL1_08962 [Corchorus capsularis]